MGRQARKTLRIELTIPTTLHSDRDL